VTVVFGNRSKQDKQIHRMQKAVAAEARVMGVETRLDATFLPPNINVGDDV